MSLQTWIFWGNEACLSRTQKGGRRMRRRRRRRRVEFTWVCSWMVAMQQTSANTVSNVLPQKQGFNILSYLISSHLISPFEHFTCPFTLPFTHSYFSSPSNSFITAKRKISHAILYWVVCITSLAICTQVLLASSFFFVFLLPVLVLGLSRILQRMFCGCISSSWAPSLLLPSTSIISLSSLALVS